MSDTNCSCQSSNFQQSGYPVPPLFPPSVCPVVACHCCHCHPMPPVPPAPPAPAPTPEGGCPPIPYYPPIPPCPPPPPPPPPVPPTPPPAPSGCQYCANMEPLSGECVCIDLDDFTVSTTDYVTDFVPFKTSKMLFKKLPTGSFMMGSLSTEIGRYSQVNKHLDFEPYHKVEISSAFACGVFPVTQMQYEKVMGIENCDCGCGCGCDGKYDSYFKLSCRAQDFVSWHEAKAFISTLNDKITSYGYIASLPSDEEWEYACRAGTSSTWCNPEIVPKIVNPNDDKDLANTRVATNLTKYASYLNGGNADLVCRSPSCFPPVGVHKPNNWGLYDVHGCVWEWCDDDSWTIQVDGKPHTEKDMKIVRGGGYWFNADDCRCANRHGYYPNVKLPGFGFRVILYQL